mgnify:CR=1 FL=1
MVKSLILILFLLLSTTTWAWGAKEREIAVELTFPDPEWTITIDEIQRVGNELWVISSVSRDQDMMGSQVISTIKASLRLEAPNLPLKYFVIGKSWEWQNQEPYSFIDDREQIDKELKNGELLYKLSQKD